MRPLFATAILLVCFAGVVLADTAELERRLPSLRGLERAKALAELTEAYESDKPRAAIAYGEQALSILRAHPDPATEVHVRNEMGWAYMTIGEYDRADAMIESGLALAERTKNKAQQAEALSNLGVVARSRGRFARAIELFTGSLEVYRSIGDRTRVAMEQNNLGFVYGTDLSDYETGLRYHLQALATRESLGDREGIGLSLNNIGIIYDRLGDYDRAFTYLTRALQLRREIGKKNRIASTLSNLGDLQLERKQYASALEYHREALALRREIGEKSGIVVSLRTLADIHVALGQLNEAEPLLAEARQLAAAMGNDSLTTTTLLSVAALERKKGRTTAALAAAQEALRISQATKAADLTRRAYEELSATEEAAGDYRSALRSYQLMKAASDRLLAETRQKQIAHLDALYQKEKRDREIQRLRDAEATQSLRLAQRRLERNAAIAFVILIVTAGALLYRRRVEAARLAEELSVTDALTGLKNRRYLTQTIDSDVAAVLRSPRPANDLVFFIIDIDFFKSVNDQRGHTAGDRLLQQIAKLIRDGSRASDVVVRWGGEEFVVVSRFVDRATAADHAERLCRMVETNEFIVDDGEPLRRTCSIGYAAFPFHREAPGALGWPQVLQLADEALYAAKRSSRNTWVGLNAATAAAAVALAQRTPGDIVRLLADGALVAESRTARDAVRWDDAPAA